MRKTVVTIGMLIGMLIVSGYASADENTFVYPAEIQLTRAELPEGTEYISPVIRLNSKTPDRSAYNLAQVTGENDMRQIIGNDLVLCFGQDRQYIGMLDYPMVQGTKYLPPEGVQVIERFDHNGRTYKISGTAPMLFISWEQHIKQFHWDAEQGDVMAQYSLGKMYEHGQGGVPQDYGMAARWYYMAAKQGFAPAQTALGDMFYEAEKRQMRGLKEGGLKGGLKD